MNDFFGPGCCFQSWCPTSDWNVVRAVVSAPPSPIVPGVIYLISSSPTGEFAGMPNRYARYSMEAMSWEFCSPIAGQRVTPEGTVGCSILLYGVNGWVELCTGSGPCDPVSVSVNGIDFAPVAAGGSISIQVLQGGIQVGSVNTLTRVVTVPTCPGGGCTDAFLTFDTTPLLSIPSGALQNIDCSTLLNAVYVFGASEIQKNGTYVSAGDVNGRDSYSLAPNHVIEWNGSQYINRNIFSGTDWITTNSPADPWSGIWVEFIGGIPIIGTVVQSTIGTYCQATCDPLTYSLVDEDDNLLQSGSVDDPCAGVLQLTAPNATVQLRNTGGVDISPVDSYLAGSVNIKVAPDGELFATDGVTPVLVIKSGGSESLPGSRIKYVDVAGASQLTAVSDTEFASGTLRPADEIARRELKNAGGTGLGVYATVAGLIANTVPNCPIPLKFVWGAGDADTLTHTITTDEAGTYTTYTQDGGSGTITYNKNGLGFVSVAGTISFVPGDTIIVRRTITTSQGFSRWVP